MSGPVMAVVVTYNRKALLERCLRTILAQTRKPDRILVVDNASTDGTRNMLAQGGLADAVDLIVLEQNTGGAGGFAEGLRRALLAGSTWTWMMDDDAEPRPDALEELMRVASDPRNVYASMAVSGSATCWATTLLGPPHQIVNEAAQVPACAAVDSLPFLGFLIHRDLVHEIGLPDAGYFIAADDIEYCLRAKRAGAQLYIAGLSRIEHPKSAARTLRVLGRDIIYLSLSPWKRYYDTRNRLLNARKYHGLRLLTQAVPGSFVRLYATLRNEPRRLAQLWAFCAGMFDGLLGIRGQRHEKWGIRL